MGAVYKATHRWTGRAVAVKVLLPEYAREEAIVQRFMNEARAAALLRSENVVDALDMGVAADGTMYLVLELLEGEALAGRLGASGRLDPGACAAALLPAMEALAVAHDAGIVHRDIKPDNIFLHRAPSGQEVPKVLDFGIARFRAVDVADPTERAAERGEVVERGRPQPRREALEGAVDHAPALGPVAVQEVIDGQRGEQVGQF